MKNNTGLSKAHLSEAIKNMPDDFALSTARFHLKEALREIEKVEHKRSKRENVAPLPNIASVPTPRVAAQRTAAFARQAVPQHPANMTNVRSLLSLIDEMIDKEKENLDFLQQPKKEEEMDFQTPKEFGGETLLG